MAKSLKNVHVKFVSLVNNPANLNDFILRKSINGKSILIKSINEEEKTVYGVVLEPDTVDAQGDTISSEEIKKAHKRYCKSMNLNIEHESLTDSYVLESYIAPTDIEFNNVIIKSGSWLMKVQCSDEDWADVKEGKLNGFSIEGRGESSNVEKSISSIIKSELNSFLNIFKNNNNVDNNLDKKISKSFMDNIVYELNNSIYFPMETLWRSIFDDFYNSIKSNGVVDEVMLKELIYKSVDEFKAYISNMSFSNNNLNGDEMNEADLKKIEALFSQKNSELVNEIIKNISDKNINENNSTDEENKNNTNDNSNDSLIKSINDLTEAIAQIKVEQENLKKSNEELIEKSLSSVQKSNNTSNSDNESKSPLFKDMLNFSNEEN